MLFHVRMDVRLPHDLGLAERAEIVAREKEYSQRLQRAGKWPHIWRIAGEYANFSIFDVETYPPTFGSSPAGAGQGPCRCSAGGVRSLTPQELQGALIVARGSTNREAAATLFPSPQTVEFRLGNTYASSVRSRSELVRHVESLA